MTPPPDLSPPYVAPPEQSAPADLLTADVHAQLLAGDEAAWHRFISEYEGRIYGYLYRLEGNSEDALDLTQEVFYRAWRSIRTFRPGERNGSPEKLPHPCIRRFRYCANSKFGRSRWLSAPGAPSFDFRPR